MPNCPICKSSEKVYHYGYDPIYKDFIMCELHGIQTVEKKVELDERKIMEG
jgi:hypothetical protein